MKTVKGCWKSALTTTSASPTRFFSTKSCHKVSWRHPRSHHWHQLDLVITQNSSLNSVQVTRSYHSADCDTDHSLVASRVRLQPKRIHRSKQKARPRINTANISSRDLQDLFADSIEQALQDYPSATAEERWNHIRDAIHHSAMEVFGKREKQNPDWFIAGITELEPVIEAKRAALAKYKSDPSVKTLTALRKARTDVKRVARRCANDYWLGLCQSIQLAADNGNTRGMYAGIKKIFGPTIKKTSHLKSTTGEIITDKKLQMERWVEHYEELYSREVMVNEATVESIESLPVMEDLDTVPSLEELTKAVNSLTSGKAPGKDGIPPDLIKAGKDTDLLRHLHELLCQCWKEGTIPHDMRDANIITLYKNKGDRNDCNNYRESPS
nr:uncharacterized protein LOC129279571 [Lytechinus pictus]